MAELSYAPALEAGGESTMRVRVPPSAPEFARMVKLAKALASEARDSAGSSPAPRTRICLLQFGDVAERNCTRLLSESTDEGVPSSNLGVSASL